MHGKNSEIIHLKFSKLYHGIKQGFLATRYHSLVIDRITLPAELIITAFSTDDGEIMGVRHREYDVEGVQFHPEAYYTEHGKILLKNFLER